MKSVWILYSGIGAFGVCALAIGCSGGSGGSSGGGTSPTPAPSSTTTNVSFTVPLAAKSEVPAISNSEASVAGTATLTLHVTKDGAGNVTSATCDLQVNASGLTAGSSLTMAHIHKGAAGSEGSILVDTGLSSGGAPVSGGAASFSKTGLNVPADVAQAIVASPGAYYFNVHSAANPGGVARGQLDGTGGAGGGGGTPPGY